MILQRSFKIVHAEERDWRKLERMQQREARESLYRPLIRLS